MPDPAATFMDQEFPTALRPLVPSALRRAYANADAAIEAVPFLQTPGARVQRGDLIAHASDYEFQRLIEAGSLPFDFAWEPFARPTGTHFVMRTPNARITISQVEDPTKRPRNAEFRNDYAVFNEPYLFPEMNEAAEEECLTKHILLLHGYHKLTFAHLALPNAATQGHIYRTPNLFDAPHDVSLLTDAEGPRESPDPEGVEKLIRYVSDNDNVDE